MTDLIEVNTAGLVGEPLNWAVLIALGRRAHIQPPEYGNPHRVFCGEVDRAPDRYRASTDWAQGGPLLDEHCKVFGLRQDGTGTNWLAFAYKGAKNEIQFQRLAGGPSILIAACRAIVKLRLGDTVQVPKELMPCS